MNWYERVLDVILYGFLAKTNWILSMNNKVSELLAVRNPISVWTGLVEIVLKLPKTENVTRQYDELIFLGRGDNQLVLG